MLMLSQGTFGEPKLDHLGVCRKPLARWKANLKPGRRRSNMIDILLVLLGTAQLVVAIYMAARISKKP